MESPEELKEEMEEARAAYEEAHSRLSALQSEVRDLYSKFHFAHVAYTASLESRAETLELELERVKQTSTAKKDLDRWIEPGPDFREIVWNVGSEESGKRVPARRALEAMGPKAVEPLLAIVRLEDIRRVRRLLFVGAVAVASTIIAFLQMAFPAAFTWLPDGLNWVTLVMLLMIGRLTRPTAMQKRAADALALIEDPRVIGPLAEALELEDRSIYRAAAYGLNRKLKKLRPSDATAITEGQMERLYRVLYGSDSELILSVLDGLGQIGDERAQKHVGRLVDRPAVTQDQIRIQTAARECQIMLTDRSIDQRAGGVLLRAAGPPGPPEESLLRPAFNASTVEVDQLLRPGSAVEDLN